MHCYCTKVCHSPSAQMVGLVYVCPERALFVGVAMRSCGCADRRAPFVCSRAQSMCRTLCPYSYLGPDSYRPSAQMVGLVYVCPERALFVGVAMCLCGCRQESSVCVQRALRACAERCRQESSVCVHRALRACAERAVQIAIWVHIAITR